MQASPCRSGIAGISGRLAVFFRFFSRWPVEMSLYNLGITQMKNGNIYGAYGPFDKQRKKRSGDAFDANPPPQVAQP